MNDPALLHLYPGSSYHNDGYIVGNREGLLALRDAINRALDERLATTQIMPKASGRNIFVKDGEGYEVQILLNDSPWQSEEWQKLAVPYTSEDAAFFPNGTIYPQELKKKLSREH